MIAFQSYIFNMNFSEKFYFHEKKKDPVSKIASKKGLPFCTNCFLDNQFRFAAKTPTSGEP